jgi:hypothetical protein
MNKSLLLAVALSFAVHAYAEDTTTNANAETKAKLEDVKGTSNTVKDGDVDEVITNKKMRAESGSKSKWSIGTSLNYNGATVEAPLKAKRPNIAASAGTTALAAMSGSVGVGYKMTATDRLSLDTGVRWVTPLEGKTPKSYKGTQYDASNPSLTYSKMTKWLGIQSVLSGGPTVFTQSDQRKYGYQQAWGLSANNIYDVGTTGLSIGLYTALDYYAFDKRLDQIDGLAAEQYQSDYDFGIDPFAEYVINDTFNLRTVFNWFNYEHGRSSDNFFATRRDITTQSVGVGISITRDIFLYPNIQFAPKDITHIFRADETNVALNTNINIF